MAIAIIFPIVGAFFLFFATLEDSGYLLRLALLVDRGFKRMGLNGRAVIPIVLGFGCDTMATLVTRTLETTRERLICTLLGHPLTCPDGHPIPRGNCCRKAEQDHVQEVGPLCDGRAGHRGVVAYLSTRDNREIQKLMAMGILPGSDICLIRLFPSYIFEIGQSQFTVDRMLAEKIFVHWQK